MTSPNSVQGFDDGFPCAEFALGSWQAMPEEVLDGVKQAIVTYGVEVEMLTKGDPKLEAIFGGLAVKIAAYSASRTTGISR